MLCIKCGKEIGTELKTCPLCLTDQFSTFKAEPPVSTSGAKPPVSASNAKPPVIASSGKVRLTAIAKIIFAVLVLVSSGPDLIVAAVTAALIVTFIIEFFTGVSFNYIGTKVSGKHK